MNISKVKNEIKKENHYSHILPFLWMKGEHNSHILEEIDKIRQCGIREICLESRPHPDFCGPYWWKQLDVIMEEAKKHNMRVWVLDDDIFPTGHCNKAFETKYPDKQKIYLAERHMDIIGPCRSNAVLVDNFLPHDGRLLGIMAFKKPDLETLAVDGEGIIDLTQNYHNGFVYFDLPKGYYRLFILFITGTGGGRENYMNLIDSDSVRVLIDEVYEEHYKHYKEYFGTTFAGFFSDEPELGNVKGYPFDAKLGKKDVRLPWSMELEALLKQEWGDRFLASLPALWYESGSRTEAIRFQYMDAVTRLVKSCFSGQIGKWCEEHDVEYIGHIIEDDNAHTRMACSTGHYFREMEGQHMSGIDVVHHQIVPGFTEPVHQWIAGDRDGEFFHYGLGKMGSSAAHIDPVKKNRALCEIFGNYGWAEGNSLMKWLTNHMLVRGINQFTPHAFSVTYPDRDCPPHFYARGNNPGFECFTHLMKYMNRAAHLLSKGVHLADAAILYHGEAEWCGHAMYFHKPGRELMEHQLDYDVVPADVLIDGRAKVKDGKLVINQESYPCLILPYARRLVREVAEFVVKGAKEGLKVFVVDGLPELDTNGKPLPEGFAKAVILTGLKKIAEAVQTVTQQPIQVKERFSGLRRIIFSYTDGLVGMFFNEDITETADTKLYIPNAYPAVTVYDPWTDREETYRLKDQEIPLKLLPGEAIFYILIEEGQCMKEVHSIDTMKGFPVLINSRPIITDWRILKKEGSEGEFKEAFVLKKEAESDSSIEKDDSIEMPNLNGPDYYPSYTGIYRYEGEFTSSMEDGADCYLLLREAGDSVQVWINGTDCGFAVGFPCRVLITDALIEGRNRIVIDAATTLVWERKDGASTHLQVTATGITKVPVLEWYAAKERQMGVSA